jgi:hypothetical protein
VTLRHTPAQAAVIPKLGAPGHGQRHSVKQSLALAAGTPFLRGYDCVTASDAPSGGSVYFYYTDGAWPNQQAVEDRFPGTILSGITTGYGLGSWIDSEPGNASWIVGVGPNVDGISSWFSERIAAGVRIPGVYTSAAYTGMLIGGLLARGWARDRFYVDAAHWTNEQHLCAENVCGYPAADITQWAGNCVPGYDIDECTFSCFVAPTPTPKPTYYLSEETSMIASTVENGNLHTFEVVPVHPTDTVGFLTYRWLRDDKKVIGNWHGPTVIYPEAVPLQIPSTPEPYGGFIHVFVSDGAGHQIHLKAAPGSDWSEFTI